MFFRRERPKPATFAERLDHLRQAGFTVAAREGLARIAREQYAVDLAERDGAARAVGRAGIVRGEEIAALTDGGYQKFFRTPSGVQLPALASELKALHDFEEDLRAALEQESFYNESLGTVSTYYLYDRVKDRDRGGVKRVWES